MCRAAVVMLLMAAPCWAAVPVDDENLDPGEMLTEGGLVREAVAAGPHQLGPIGRGAHGLWNMVIAPLELPATIAAETQVRDNFVVGLLSGFGGGCANFIVRELAGIAEVLTVPVMKKTEPLYVRKLGEPTTLPDPFP